MLFALFCVGVVSAERCDPGWSYFNGNCYKNIYNYNNRIYNSQAVDQCAAKNSYLTSVESPAEQDFLAQLASRLGDWDLKNDAITAYAPSPSLQITKSMYSVGIIIGGRETESMYAQYLCKKSAPCPVGTELKSDGSCGCRKDYFDITDTDCPERRQYRKGEMCIPRIPCQNVTSKDSLSIVFVVDSSQSIANWKNMVKFLKSGSRLLDNTINVAPLLSKRAESQASFRSTVRPYMIRSVWKKRRHFRVRRRAAPHQIMERPVLQASGKWWKENCSDRRRSLAYGDRCEPGWSLFNGNCYKHIMNWNNMISHDQAQVECAHRNAFVTGVESQAESDFISKLASRKGDWALKQDALTVYAAQANLQTTPVFGDGVMVMGTRDSSKNWRWPRSGSTWFNWCPPTEPSNYDNENCLIFALKAGTGGCLWDTPCVKTAMWNNQYARYICKKAADCQTGAERQANGNCGCKKDYFDITDTDCPEKRDYKKGEMCIPRIPCQNVTSKDSLSIVFVVDSSQSIGASNWKNMVTFLKSGSRQLDNSISVGFVQFSTNVTYSEWLPRRWSKDDYLDQMPSSFDAGYTNTPAALDEAGSLFRSDRSTHQVAVLITDGMPYVEDILPKEDAMPKTTEAAEKLRKAGIDLVALGYGKELVKYQSYLKKILANPHRDYFEYDKEAGDLKDIHMTVLLNKVCARFQ